MTGTVTAQPIDTSHRQACLDLENATQVITHALQHAVSKNQELCVVMRRLEEREAETAQSLKEQVEANQQLGLKVEELHKLLEEKDNSLTQANQAVAFLRDKLKDLHQQLPQEETEDGTFQERLQDKECGLQSHLVSSAPMLLESPVSGLKEEEREAEAYDDGDDADHDGGDDADHDDGGQYVEGTNPTEEQSVLELNQIQLLRSDEMKVEGANYGEPGWSEPSASDMKSELIQGEEAGLNMAPVLRSEPARDVMSLADPLHLARFTRVSVKLVDCCKTQGLTGTENSKAGEHHEVNGAKLSCIAPSGRSTISSAQQAVSPSPISPQQEDSRTPSDDGFRTNLPKQKKKKESSTGKGRHHCDQCGQSFHQLEHLVAHQCFHSREKPYSCSLCNKTFQRERNLKRHMRGHEPQKPFKCGQCGQSFLFGANLRVHHRIHTGEKPYQCTQCGKRFCQSGNLKAHQRTHTGEKPHQCTLCGNRFSDGVHLRRHHQLIHVKDKPYQCPQCGKRFSQKYNLKLHQKTHMKVSPSHRT